VPPPTAICDNGDWTDWTGNCTAADNANTTVQNGTSGNNTAQTVPQKLRRSTVTVTKASSTTRKLCSRHSDMQHAVCTL
jgi:hypothetical protein